MDVIVIGIGIGIRCEGCGGVAEFGRLLYFVLVVVLYVKDRPPYHRAGVVAVLVGVMLEVRPSTLVVHQKTESTPCSRWG